MKVKASNKESFYVDSYDKYNYSLFEWILYCAIGVLVMAFIGWIFYRNVAISTICSLLGLLYPKIKRKKLIEKRRNVLRLQVRDLLYYLGAALTAGMSVEKAFFHVYGTLQNLYPDKRSDIVIETYIILKRLQMNENIESILKDFATRSGIEEIHHFADVFSVCKRSGGNLVEIISTTSRMIGERIEIKQEIETSLTSKKQEQRILSISSIAMVAFISAMSGDFIEPMFVTASGRVVMTVALVMLICGILLSNKIMNIKF